MDPGGMPDYALYLRFKRKRRVLIENRQIQCPYCGELTDIQIDTSIALQSYIEDCTVCCQPIELEISVIDEIISVTARTGNE